MKKTFLAALLMTTIYSVPAISSPTPNGEALFKSNCTMCHDVTKKKLGPAVTDMSKDAGVLRTTITSGRNAMPSYGSKLSAAEIDALVEFLLSNQ